MGKKTPEVEPGKRVTLQVLAKHLDLSTTTVSVVVSDSPAARGIPPKTRERILAAAKKLNYRPNYMARSLRGTRSMSIGILVPETSEGYFTLVMNGVEQYLMDANYLYFSASHYHKKELLDESARLLVERSVDGLLLVSTPVPANVHLPMVSISGPSDVPGIGHVVLDHRKAAVMALTYLRDLGHTRIAFMKGQDFNADTDARWGSIVGVARELGISIDPKLLIQLNLNVWSPRVGYEPVRQFLTTPQDFTAMFCFNDLSAIGAIRALHEVGLKVPEDVSVIGFDDITMSAYGIPSLTTVGQPLAEMGRLAAATLLARIRNPEENQVTNIALDPSLVVRESTGPPPKPKSAASTPSKPSRAKAK
jgi:DNA-binding LacI/PurR family transcriptional regulator